MADLSFNTVQGTPPQTGMSLSDILNIAKGTQAYQQAQQVNPYLAQTAQSESQQTAAKAQQAQAESASTVQARQEQVKVANFMSNPQNWQNADGTVNEKAIMDNVSKLAPQTYAEQANRALTLAKTQTEAKQAIQNLNTQERGIVGSVFGALGRAGIQDPKAYITGLQGLAKDYPDSPHIQNLANASIEQLKLTPQNADIAKNAVIAASSLLNPTEQASLFGPKTMVNAASQIVQTAGPTGTIQQPPTAGFGTQLNPSAPGIAIYTEYSKDLNTRVAASNNVMQRTEEAERFLSGFKPGAGTATYQGLAQRLQAIGAPQSIVDKVAGGDLSAAQSAQKFLAGNVIASVRQAAGGQPARVSEIDEFLKNNPTIESDPRTLQNFINFSKKMANRDFAEQDFLLNKIKSGTLNPDTFPLEANQYLRSSGLIPQPKAGTTPAQAAEKTVVKTGKDRVTGRTVVQYSDGSLGYK